jgi:hypothetical protein
MTILVGTASWADKSLVDSGKFYPADVTSPEGAPAVLRLCARSAARVAEMSQAVPVVHALMSNNYEDQGQRNAKTLTALLGRARRLT